MPRPRWKPGQFLHLALDPYDPSGHWPESRCFTMASGSLEKEFVRLTIAAKGTFTRRILAELQPGRKVWMKAPYGDFIVRTSRGARRGVDCRRHGHHALRGLHGRRPGQGAGRATSGCTTGPAARTCWSFATLPSAARGSSLPFAWTATPKPAPRVRRSPAGSIWRGRSACAGSGKAATYYLCGPQEMINAFRARLTGEFGVPSRT